MNVIDRMERIERWVIVSVYMVWHGTEDVRDIWMIEQDQLWLALQRTTKYPYLSPQPSRGISPLKYF